MSVVIDSSYALACMMPDEKRPQTMEQVLGSVLLAPFIWPIEIASAMRNGVRRRRLARSQALDLTALVAGLGAKIVAPWHDTAARYLELSLSHDLTPYDAIYIDLCLGERCTLATCDGELAKAAARVGIRIHD